MSWFVAVAHAVRPLPPTMEPSEIVVVHTEDGWALPVRHYPGDGPPVLLVHGMAVNHYNWDYREEISVADALADAGWDVWIPELRGDPGAERVEDHGRAPITFDGYVSDLRAVVHGVLDHTGDEALYWVGHSMGGMLLYAWLSEEPSTVVAGVTICSPVQFAALDVPWTVKALRPTLGGDGRVPARAVASMVRPLGRTNPLYGRLANRENLDWPITRGMARHALVNLSKPLARQALGWARSGELLRLDGSPWVVPAQVPLLVLGAPLDRVVAEPDVRAACDVYPNCEYRVLSRAAGFTADYGHVDPVIGYEARAEIYPLVSTFLADHLPSP